MGQKQNQRSSIGMESTYGDGGASFTDIPLHVGAMPDFTPPVFEQPVFRGTLARNAIIVGGAPVKIPVKLYAKGSGAAGTAPELGKLLRAAGMLQTISGGVSVAYTPRDTGHESIGFKHNLDGVEHLLIGARIGTGKMTFKGKEPMLIEADIEGLYVEPTLVALGSATYADVAIRPPIVQSMALTWGAQSYIIPSLEITFNNSLNEFESINAGNLGINSLEYSDLRDWKFKLRVRRVAANDTEFYNALTAGTELAVTSTGFGSAGNKIALVMNKVQFTKVMPVDEKGMLYYDCDGNINYDSTTEFSLTFT